MDALTATGLFFIIIFLVCLFLFFFFVQGFFSSFHLTRIILTFFLFVSSADPNKTVPKPSLMNQLMQMRKVCNHPALFDANYDNFYHNFHASAAERVRGSRQGGQGV